LRIKFRDNAQAMLDLPSCELVEQAVAGMGKGTQPRELLSLIHTQSRS
jgi:hypothetical protein